MTAGFHFDITTTPPTNIVIRNLSDEHHTLCTGLKQREKNCAMYLYFALLGASMVWYVASPFLSPVIQLFGSTFIFSQLIFGIVIALEGEFGLSALVAAATLVGTSIGWIGYFLESGNLVDVALLSAASINLIFWFCLCIVWDRRIADPLRDAETAESGLRPLNTADHAEECISFVEFCEHYPVVKHYQNAVAASGRVPVLGEYFAARRYVLNYPDQHQANVAWHRLSNPI